MHLAAQALHLHGDLSGSALLEYYTILKSEKQTAVYEMYAAVVIVHSMIPQVVFYEALVL